MNFIVLKIRKQNVMKAKYIFTDKKDLNTKIVADYRPASSVVTFSPDGQLMATAGWQGVRIYRFNNANPILITTLKDHSRSVSSVSFSLDGNYLASGSRDNTVKVYSVSNGRFSLIKSLDDHSYAVTTVSFSPDGKYLATGSSDHTVKVYSVSNGSFSLVKSLDDHRAFVTSVSFSPDGKYLATGPRDNTVKVYSVSNGSFSLIKSLEDHSGWVKSVSFSPNSKYLASGGADGTIIYKVTEILHSAILSVTNSTFTDKNNNGILEAGENAAITLNIQNIGKGRANNLGFSINVSPDVQGISYTLPSAIDIEPNETKTITIPISTTVDLPTKNLSIKLSFTEDNGFQPVPILFNVTTKKLPAPELKLTTNANSVAKQSTANVTFQIQNTGIGKAEDVKIK